MKVSSNTEIIKFKHNNKKYTIIGENHQDIKKNIGGNIKEGLLLLECDYRYNNKKISTLLNHYKNKKDTNTSYIDLSLLYFTKKYYNQLNKNKRFKTIVNNKKIKVKCIDDRSEEDFPKIQIYKLRKKYPEKFKIIKNRFDLLKKEINKIKQSKIKDKLLKKINHIINVEMKSKLTDSSVNSAETLSQIILDFEIINNYILNNENIKEKNITIIVGKNHLKNIKKYLEI